MANNDKTLTYDASLNARHISTDLEHYEAARSNFFTLIVDGLDDIIKATYTGDPEDATDGDRIHKAQETLKLNVVQASVPHFQLNPISYTRGNEVVKFAGTPSWNSASIEVDDVVGKDTKGILMAWQALAYHVSDGRGGRMKDYKKTATLVEYTQDYQQIRAWRLYGCWVSNITEGNFDRGGGRGDLRRLTATIEYDRAEMLEV